MHFTQLTLHNFGIYKGTHRLDITVQKDKKNVTLIGGLNGRGKTTILEAIFISLYGRNAKIAIQDKRASYSKMLSSRLNKMAEDDMAYVQVNCVLEEKGNQELIIKRSWKKREKGKTTTDDLEVWVDGNKDLVMAQNWDYYVNEILPVSIARFFFFDNEKISEIAEDESFNQIKDSIKSLMGISTIDILIADTKKLIKQKSEQLSETGNEELKKAYKSMMHERESIEESIKEHEKRENELIQEIGCISAEIELKEDEFWKEGGFLGIKKEEIEDEKERLNDKKNEIIAQMQKIVLDAGAPLVLCQSLVEDTRETCEKNERLITKQQSLRIVKELRTKLSDKICGQISDETTRAYILKLIYEEFDKYDNQFAVLDFFTVSGTSINLLKKLSSSGLMEIEDMCINVLEELDKVDSELLQIKNHLDNSINELEVKEMYQAIKALEDNRAIKIAEQKILEKEKISLSMRNRELEKDAANLLSRIASTESKVIKAGKIINYATMTLNVMDEFKMRLQKKKVNGLERSITDCFRFLAGKKNMISQVKIDVETLDIMLLDAQNKEVFKSQLSAGEKQIFAVAVLWGLAISSGYQMPVIIDTPMARLDSTHRKNFVAKYLPNASSQVIVLSTDEEIYGRYLGEIMPYVNACYTLVYNNESESSSVASGYFGEELCS